MFSWGYDYFIGWAIDESKNRSLVKLDLSNENISEYVKDDFLTAGRDLYYLVHQEKKILLFESPGIRKEKIMTLKDMEKYMQESFHNYRQNLKTTIDPDRGHAYVRPKLAFETLNEKELEAVKQSYLELGPIFLHFNPFKHEPIFTRN